MIEFAEQIEVLQDEWLGCYRGGWGSLLVPEAFAHPAKVARGLAERIYQHVIDEQWVKVGDSVVDPFGGIAGCGFHAMLNGLHFVGIELEAKFVELGRQNIALWNERYSRMPNWGTARLLQGDSRKLADVIFYCRVSDPSFAVSSPPYANQEVTLAQRVGCFGDRENMKMHTKGRDEIGRRYGQSEGQLGAMKEGDLNLAISSPPYAGYDDHGGRATAKERDDRRLARLRPDLAGRFDTCFKGSEEYGETEGQLGSMKEGDLSLAVSSPPFSQPETRDRAPVQDGSVSDFMTRAYTVDRQGVSEGNVAALPQSEESFQAAVTSPPYEGIRMDGGKIAKEEQGGMRPYSDDPVDAWMTTRDQVNIGNNRPDDFWSASRVILEQLYQVLTPGAHAVFIVKAFVRNKQIIDFPGQWAQLCEAVGFQLLHDHHAMLTEHHGVQQTMSGEDKHFTVARKSFFRRLAESKGSPKIDFENVLCFEKPLERSYELS